MSKNRLLILILLIGTSCSSDKKSNNDPDEYKISKKEYSKFLTDLPAGVCIYTYGPNHTETQDSCNKYEIGDQINH